MSNIDLDESDRLARWFIAEGHEVTAYTRMLALTARVREQEQEMAELRRKCPDCGSPQPGDMCAVCALAHAEEELVALRRSNVYLAERVEALEEQQRGILSSVIVPPKPCAPDDYIVFGGKE